MADAVSLLSTTSSGASQIMAAREITEGHPAVPGGQGRAVPPWLLVAALFGSGGGGASIAAAFGSFGSADVEALAKDVERDREAQERRIDDHDDDLDSLRREQTGNQRWVADQLLTQSRALAKIAEKVGAAVDTDVEPYQSGGM